MNVSAVILLQNFYLLNSSDYFCSNYTNNSATAATLTNMTGCFLQLCIAAAASTSSGYCNKMNC